MATFGVCDSFKAEVLQAIHNPANHVFKLALYNRPSGSAAINAATAAYAATIGTAVELAQGNGYTTGGIVLLKDTDLVTDLAADLANATVRKNTTSHIAGLDWADPVWTSFTWTAGTPTGASSPRSAGFYALIYNSTLAGKNAVAFGEWVTNDLANDPSAANFTISLPGSGKYTVQIGP